MGPGILGRLSLPGTLRLWSLIGLLAVVCIGVIVIARPSSDGRAVTQASPSSVDTPRMDPGVQQPSVQTQTAAQGAGPTTAPIAPELTQWGQTMARELANLEQGIEQLKTSQAQLARDNADLAGRLKETQEEIAQRDAELAEGLKAARDEMVGENLNLTEQLKASQDQIPTIREQLSKAREQQVIALEHPSSRRAPAKLASPASPRPNASAAPKPTPKPAPKSSSAQSLPKNSTQSQPKQQ